jgi:lysophospholipase L1-like esterase
MTTPVPSAAPRLPRKRRLIYATLAMGLAFAVCVLGLLAVDVYLHHRVQYTAGVNVWGYRGDTVGEKEPREQRLIALGGSTVFGYGLPWNESWPYYLEQKLAQGRERNRPVRVVNLGVPADTARTFAYTLDAYEYLEPDVVLLYEGYNDLGLDSHEFRGLTNPDVPHYIGWRYQSPIFRWTGYFPIFPLVLNEKAMAMLSGGDLQAAYKDRVVFQPGLATRVTAEALKTASDLGVAIEKRLADASNTGNALTSVEDGSCGPWAQYCGAILEAVGKIVARDQYAVVIGQPTLGDIHVQQQARLRAALERAFPNHPRVRYLDLSDAVNMQDASLVYDGIHLVARGNEIVAERLAPLIQPLLQ